MKNKERKIFRWAVLALLFIAYFAMLQLIVAVVYVGMSHSNGASEIKNLITLVCFILMLLPTAVCVKQCGVKKVMLAVGHSAKRPWFLYIAYLFVVHYVKKRTFIGDWFIALPFTATMLRESTFSLFLMVYTEVFCHSAASLVFFLLLPASVCLASYVLEKKQAVGGMVDLSGQR